VQLQDSSQKDTLELVKAPQAVVHIKHSITLQQYKIWLIVLQKFREFYLGGEQYDENGLFRIQKSEIDDLIGYEVQKTKLRNDLNALRKEDIIISILGKGGEKSEQGMGFISRWELSSKTVAVELPPFLIKVMKGLDQPKAMFQLLNWNIFNHFSGKNEAVVYKLCRDYVGAGNTPYMTISEFRTYMGLNHNEYEQFMELNKFVIKRSVEKINQSSISDIEIEAQFRTEGRRKIGLYFKVTKKKQTSIQFAEIEDNPAFRYSKIHIETSLQMEYLSMRTADEIELCIERANEYGQAESEKGNTPNYGALYRKSITDGWHIAYAQTKAESIAKQVAKSHAILKKTDEIEAAKNKNQELADWTEKTLLAFSELSQEAQNEIRNKYAESLTDVMRKSFEKQAEKSKMHRYLFAKFFTEHYLEKAD